MFSTKLSLLLLTSLSAVPAIAAARPDAARDGALTDEVRKTHARAHRIDRAPQSERMGGLCERLACSAEQREAIIDIRHDTRMRIRDARKDALGEAAIDRILAGGLGRIGAVLDAGQRAELERLVAEHGPKIAFGGGLRAKRSPEHDRKSERGDTDRVAKAHKSVAKPEKRVVTAKKELAMKDRRSAKAAKRLAAKKRHSAKA